MLPAPDSLSGQLILWLSWHNPAVNHATPEVFRKVHLCKGDFFSSGVNQSLQDNLHKHVIDSLGKESWVFQKPIRWGICKVET